MHFSFIQFLISFESDQAHQNPENPSNMGTGPLEKVPEADSYRMLCTPPHAPSHESMFHPGFGGTDVKPAPQYFIEVKS